MTTPAIQGTALRVAWPLPFFLLRTAWADQPYDELTEVVAGAGEAHLLEVVGDPVAALDGARPAAGPGSLLPGLVAGLRRAGSAHPAPEVLSLLTSAPGDVSSVPPVDPVRSDVAGSGVGVLARDPGTGEAVCLTVRDTGGGVMRWRARGLAHCPVAPQPDGPAHAMAVLGAAVVEAAELIERASASGGSVAAPTAIDFHPHVTRLPSGLTPRVIELVDRIDRVEAVVTVALALPGVGSAAAEREPVLRRLVAALDAGRRAAVAAAGDAALRGT